MEYEVDVISEVILLVDGESNVVDAFQASGRTIHRCAHPVTHYTYRSLLTEPGRCILCGTDTDRWTRPCVSSGGCHAFVGRDTPATVPPEHWAANRNLPLRCIRYDEFTFYLEADNLFGVAEIRRELVV